MSDLEARKQLGKSHLYANRVNEALEVYSAILKDYPDDTEARIFLGDCYLAAGHGGTAISHYKEVLMLDPDNIDLQQRLMLAEDEVTENTGPHARTSSMDKSELESLVTKITGEQTSLKISEEQLQQAKLLLQEIFASEHPSQIISQRLDEVYEQLPAILELNVRQAQTDGQWDLAREIENFVQQLQEDGSMENFIDYDTIPVKINKPDKPARSKPFNLLFLSEDKIEEDSKFKIFADGLEQLGEKAIVKSDINIDELNNFDTVIAHNPHVDPKISKILAACAGNRIPILVYLDEDFENLPDFHPEYERFSLNSPEKIKDYNVALKLADRLIVNKSAAANRLKNEGYEVSIIKNGWSDKNELWSKPAPKRHSINIGWIGDHGTVEDINSIRRAIVRVMREFPETSLVITGTPAAYQLFDAVSETRRLYLPPVERSDFPYQLAHIDILLLPKIEKPENSLGDDQILIEAGVRRIPWVASPTPAFESWNTGGIFSSDIDAWHSNIRKLVVDPDERNTIGASGSKAAQAREATQLAKQWQSLIENLNKNPKQETQP